MRNFNHTTGFVNSTVRDNNTFFLNSALLTAIHSDNAGFHFYFPDSLEGMEAKKKVASAIAAVTKTKPVSELDYNQEISEKALIRLTVFSASLKQPPKKKCGGKAAGLSALENVGDVLTPSRITDQKHFHGSKGSVIVDAIESSGLCEFLGMSAVQISELRRKMIFDNYQGKTR